MKIVFFGTSEFAVPILKAIKEKTDWEIGLVVSESAKPAGRSNKITDSLVAKCSKENDLNLVTPISVKDIAGDIKTAEPDIAIVVAYGQIIPRSIFDIPKFKTVNIHPSLLPKLRGPSPIQTALLEGLKETGVSLMLIDEKMDRGPVLSQEKVKIADEDNYRELENKLSDLGSKILIRDLPKYIAGIINPMPQNEADATYTHLIKKEDGRADWNKSAGEIYNQWRAFSKWPGLFTFSKDRLGRQMRLKLIEIYSCHSALDAESRFSDLDAGSKSGMTVARGNGNKPGTIITDGQKNLFISCGSGAINVKKLQPENSKTQTAAEFINGYGYVIGQKLF